MPFLMSDVSMATKRAVDDGDTVDDVTLLKRPIGRIGLKAVVEAVRRNKVRRLDLDMVPMAVMSRGRGRGRVVTLEQKMSVASASWSQLIFTRALVLEDVRGRRTVLLCRILRCRMEIASTSNLLNHQRSSEIPFPIFRDSNGGEGAPRV